MVLGSKYPSYYLTSSIITYSESHTHANCAPVRNHTRVNLSTK